MKKSKSSFVKAKLFGSKAMKKFSIFWLVKACLKV